MDPRPLLTTATSSETNAPEPSDKKSSSSVGLRRRKSSEEGGSENKYAALVGQDEVDQSFSSNDSQGDGLEPTGTAFGATLTLANTALGAGILAFPYAFEQSGLGLGLILVVAIAVLTATSQEMVVMGVLECKQKEKLGAPKIASYDAMVRSLLGPAWGNLMEVLIAIYQFGACVAYILVAQDQLEPLLKCVVCGGECCQYAPIDEDSGCDCSNLICNRVIIILLCTWAVMFPPCLLRDVSTLKYVSVIGVSCPFIMSAIIVYYGIDDMVNHGAKVDLDNIQWFSGSLKGAFVALPIFCFALQSHISVPCIFRGVKEELQTKKNFGRVVFAAYSIILALYIPTGAFGLAYFLENKTGDFPKDVLTGFQTNKVLADVARCCMAVGAMCAFSLNHFPARCAIFNIIFRGEKSVDDMENKNTIYVVEAVVFSACACGLAIAVPNVATVFGVLGATIASSSMFIFPGLVLYHYVTAHDFVLGSPNLSGRSPQLTPVALQRQTSTFALPKKCNPSMAVGLGYVAIGIVIAVIGTYASLL
eukprot:g3910.t1